MSREQLPTPLASNVAAVWRQASREEVRAGAIWYEEAFLFASSLSPVNPTHAAAVIAALSPNTSWVRNKELAVRAYTDGQASGTIGRSVRMANEILAMSWVNNPLSVLSGPKVRNFYLSIIGNPSGVCVDRHALEVAVGVRYKDADRPKLTTKNYEIVAQAYRSAAGGLGQSPAVLQATTWLTWRRLHLTGTQYERFL